MRLELIGVAAAAALLAACGGPKECKLDDPASCDEGFVCESVTGRDQPLCFRPVEIRGQVFDLQSDAAIAGATVTAVGENDEPIGSVATTDSEGHYVVAVPTVRTDDEGAFESVSVSLRAAAKDYDPFPNGIRTAIPFETSTAAQADEKEPWVVEGTLTRIGLAKLPAEQLGWAAIRGEVAVPAGKSALVVAHPKTAGLLTKSAIADASGSYVIFNVEAGDYTVRAYTQGTNYTAADVTMASADLTDVNLAAAGEATATVAGSVSFVAGGSPPTSVIVVVKSTFDPNAARGQAPGGLRAGDVSNNFAITGVPDGEYAVLAGFENDGVVRDPDTNQSGTDVQFVTVNGGTVSALNAFKLTDAVEMVGPGANGLEELTTATPTFSWRKYPQTAKYVLTVVDSLGQTVWSAESTSGGDPVTLAYTGDTLQDGMIYQWRVTAVATQPTTRNLSRTEDLRGVFQVKLQ